MTTKKKRPIFRREVIEAQISRHGEVVLIRPTSFTMVTGFISLLILVVVLFFKFGHYTKSIRVKGILKTTAGVSKIMAYQPGVIEELLVIEGERVVKDQPLYKIRTDRQGLDSSLGDIMASSIQESIRLMEEKITFQLNLNRLELEDNDKKAVTLLNKAEALDDEINLQKDYLKLLNFELSEIERSLKSGLVSKTEYNAKYAQTLEKQITVRHLSRTKNDFLNQAEDAKNQRRNIEIKGNTRIVSYQQTLADLNRQLANSEAGKHYYINSPGFGIVANVFYQQGHFAESNRPLMNILPENGKLVAEIYIPTSAIGFVKKEQAIQLRYHAFPYQKFGLYSGRVKSISKTLIEPFQAEIDSMLDEPAYRAIVSLEQQQVDAQGKMIGLQSGMLLDADIIGDTRTLLSWVFEPILTAAEG